MSFSPRNLARVTGTALGVAGAAQAGAYAAAKALGRRDTVDVAWGPGLAAIAVASALTGEGDRARRTLLAGGVTAWGGRLGWHILQRLRGTEEEDPRYTELLEGDSELRVATKLYLTQGAVQWFVSLPVQVAAASGPPIGPARALVPLGLALMGGGVLTEAVADRQLAAYRARPREERPGVMDRGLWGWSRHPNHFGDACVWTGAYVVAAAARPGAWTFLSPAAMTWFLVVATGARRMEKRMQDRPAYADYQRRVSFFVPLPPKTRPDHHQPW